MTLVHAQMPCVSSAASERSPNNAQMEGPAMITQQVHTERQDRVGTQLKRRVSSPDADEIAMIIALAVEWLPFSGPSAEDIWVRFGIRPHHFWHRVADELRHPTWHLSLGVVTISALQDRAMTFSHGRKSRLCHRY
jgi:hypothetical protein